jgi:hypothetical protein
MRRIDVRHLLRNLRRTPAVLPAAIRASRIDRVTALAEE